MRVCASLSHASDMDSAMDADMVEVRLDLLGSVPDTRGKDTLVTFRDPVDLDVLPDGFDGMIDVGEQPRPDTGLTVVGSYHDYDSTPGADAIGFAVYLDELDRLSAPLPPVQQQKTDRVMLNVALPKGRLGDKVYGLLARIGYGCAEDYNATRKLVVENPEAGIRYFLVKPSDVAIYVEHGAADVGIVGKDILTEASADVYELLDTGLGRCRMCVAAPNDYQDDPSRPVRVATKFVSIAKNYYASIGRDIDIIKLNGSIELAPILGLSDVIVDIVETGTTLRENGLKVVTEFLPISARFIANKASYQFKHREVDRMLEQLRETLQEAAK